MLIVWFGEFYYVLVWGEDVFESVVIVIGKGFYFKFKSLVLKIFVDL